MVVGGIRRRGCGNAPLFFILLENIPSLTRQYRFWFILPSNLSVSRYGKVFLRLDTKVACTTIKLAQNDIVYFRPSFQVPLALGLDRCTPALSFGSQYPIPWIWFLIPHRSTFVSSTPPINFRLKYPTYWISFFIPLCSVFVFNTPILEFGFLNPMCEFRFTVSECLLYYAKDCEISFGNVSFLSESMVQCV